MTAVRVPGTPSVGRALAWHVPPHAVMLAAMTLVMTPGADGTGHLIAAVALGGLALGLAPFARAHHEVHCVLLDLGAMVFVLAAIAMSAPGGDAHAHGGPGIPLAVVASIAWLVARVRLTRGRVAAVTGMLCGLMLAAMLLA